MRTSARIAASAAILATSTLVGVGPAQAADQSLLLNGDVEMMPGMMLSGMPLAHIDAQATGTGWDTTGTWAAQANGLPVSDYGPITCLTVEGDTASLLYPITSATPIMPVAPDSYAIQVTVTKGVNGQPAQIGFIGPMPTEWFTDCRPGMTTMAFDGQVEF